MTRTVHFPARKANLISAGALAALVAFAAKNGLACERETVKPNGKSVFIGFKFTETDAPASVTDSGEGSLYPYQHPMKDGGRVMVTAKELAKAEGPLHVKNIVAALTPKVAKEIGIKIGATITANRTDFVVFGYMPNRGASPVVLQNVGTGKLWLCDSEWVKSNS
jgi:hypothetical protein